MRNSVSFEKLEKIVNENLKEEDDKLSKENNRNSRPLGIDKNKHHSLENPLRRQKERRETSNILDCVQ